MGNTSSKQGQQQETTRVFLPKSPVEISSGLIEKFENSVESDYTRSQYKEKYIQQRVTKELENLQLDGAVAFEEAVTKIPTPSDEGENESEKLKQRLQSLKAILEQQTERAIDEDTLKARDTLVQCFKDNQGKPLKCVDELEAFKARVRGTDQA